MPALSDKVIADLLKLGNVLNSPARLRLIEALSTQELCVKDMAEVVSLHSMTVRRHIQVLAYAGVVSRRLSNKRKQYYILDAVALQRLLATAQAFATQKEIGIAPQKEAQAEEEEKEEGADPNARSPTQAVVVKAGSHS